MWAETRYFGQESHTNTSQPTQYDASLISNPKATGRTQSSGFGLIILPSQFIICNNIEKSCPPIAIYANPVTMTEVTLSCWKEIQAGHTALRMTKTYATGTKFICVILPPDSTLHLGLWILLFSSLSLRQSRICNTIWQEALIVPFLFIQAFWIRCWLLVAPAEHLIEHQPTIFDKYGHLGGNPFSQKPGAELDNAWHQQLAGLRDALFIWWGYWNQQLGMNIRISEKWLTPFGAKSIKLSDGPGVIAQLGVYHELHCLVSFLLLLFGEYWNLWHWSWNVRKSWSIGIIARITIVTSQAKKSKRKKHTLVSPPNHVIYYVCTDQNIWNRTLPRVAACGRTLPRRYHTDDFPMEWC